MKTKIYSIIALGILIGLSSCDKNNDAVVPVKKEIFSGYVQKGPFLNGSSVIISELDASLNQTGRSYSTTVAGNTGNFEQKKIELISNFVQLKADGYYFNEVNGESSSGQLTLYALADISQVNSANVNVLTHLEKNRVEYLLQQKGLSFADAKKQAQTEVLKIFNLALPDNYTSESLDLSAVGEKNAILLAVSCILQGSLSTAEMSELMANIISDIKTDGTLDSPSLGSALIDNARLINLNAVRKHLETKYLELGLTNVTIPDFESRVHEFLTKSTFTPVKFIVYPVSGANGLNLLNDTVKSYKSGVGYSMKVDLPQGTSLRIILKGKKNSWGYALLPAPQNWTISNYNDITLSQEYVVTDTNKPTDLFISFNDYADSVSIEYYENNAISPTKTRVIARLTDNPPIDHNVIVYPETGMFVNYYNILNDSLKITRSGKIYSMSAFIPTGKTLKVILKGTVKGWITTPDNDTPMGWIIGAYNDTAISQEFNTTGPKSDMSFTFPANERVTIEIYENNAVQPTRIRYLNY